MKFKPSTGFPAIPLGTVLSTLLFAGSVQAAVIVTVTDTRPGETAATTPSTTAGSVSTSAPGTVFPTTYTISGLDLSAYGGGVGESIAFTVSYSQTDGTGVQVNGFGNISVTGGGDNNQVDGIETITATVALNVGSSTFSGDFGDFSIGFVGFTTGGVSTGTDEQWNIITASGTQSFTSPTSNSTTFALSSFVTLDPVAGNTHNGTFNVQGFIVEISGVPEPSVALLGGIGLLALLRRRR